MILGIVVLGGRVKRLFPTRHLLHEAWPFLAALAYALAYQMGTAAEAGWGSFPVSVFKVWLGVAAAAIVLYEKGWRGRGEKRL